jgi:hypothetical protein
MMNSKLIAPLGFHNFTAILPSLSVATSFGGGIH